MDRRCTTMKDVLLAGVGLGNECAVPEIQFRLVFENVYNSHIRKSNVSLNVDGGKEILRYQVKDHLHVVSIR